MMNPDRQTSFCANGIAQDRHTDIVVAGFGSPHGDDQAGWQVVAVLKRQASLPARLVRVTEGTQLLDHLETCRRLIVIDACRGGLQIGAITRFVWPDPRIRQYHNHSTHGVGLCNALELAERLGRMPPMVEVFGIDIGSCQPLDEICAEVAQAVSQLTEVLSWSLVK